LCSAYVSGSEKEKLKTEAGGEDKTVDFSAPGAKWDLKPVK